MISASDRENAVLLINEAIASGASCKKACWTVWIVNFNTSHVTVYLFPIMFPAVFHADFNTSHVTVYLKSGGRRRSEKKFQYISCYGLSALSKVFQKFLFHFNTSHVTVYL